MPALSDIAFECPHCDGPLIAETAHAGLATDCPHCLRSIIVPAGHPVNKGSYVEPLGLRRILEQVRDREWEEHRRKLRVALALVSELEGRLRRTEVALEEQRSEAASAERLRAQVDDLNERFAQVNAMFETARRQQEAATSAIQRELQASRAEADRLRRENDDLHAEHSRGKSCGQARSQSKRTAKLAVRF